MFKKRRNTGLTQASAQVKAYTRLIRILEDKGVQETQRLQKLEGRVRRLERIDSYRALQKAQQFSSGCCGRCCQPSIPPWE